MIRSPVEFDKFAFHFFVFELSPEGLNPSRRKLPVVVKTGAIFPVLQFVACDALAGKEPHGFKRREMKGTANVHQDAINVEDDQFGRVCRVFAGFRSETQYLAAFVALKGVSFSSPLGRR